MRKWLSDVFADISLWLAPIEDDEMVDDDADDCDCELEIWIVARRPGDAPAVDDVS